MTDLSDNEINAIVATGIAAGAHLDHLGKTDLAQMDEWEWMGFIEATVMAYADKMAALHAPYAVLRSTDDPMVGGYQQPPTRPTGPITSAEIPY